MSRPYCTSPFWDPELTWNTNMPQFTACFENTALTLIPCAAFMIISPIYLTYIFNCPITRSDPLPLTRLAAFKTIISMVMAFLVLMNFFRTVQQEISGLEPDISFYIAPIVQSLALIWTIILMNFERKTGVIASAPMFLFWLVLSFFGLGQFLSYAQQAQSDTYRVVVYSLYYACLVVQLIFSCLVDALPPRLAQDMSISPEARASFLSYMTFHWITPLCLLGYRKSLTQGDLYKLHPRDEAKKTVPQFEKHWLVELAKRGNLKSVILDSPPSEESAFIRPNKDATKNYEATDNTVSVSLSEKIYQPSLMRALIRTYAPRVVLAHLGRFIYDMCNFVGPTALQWLISFTQNKDEPAWHGYVYALTIFAAGIFGSMCFNQFFHLAFTTANHIKASLMTVIYKKALTMSNKARRDATVGEIVNLMSVDIERLVQAVHMSWVIWSAPVQVVIVMTMLWAQVGSAAFAGLIVLVLLIPINVVVSTFIKRQQAKQLIFKDKRLRLMSEIMVGIKVLKLYAWEIPFIEKVLGFRKEELALLRKSAYLQGISQFTFVCAPYLVLLSTFTTYTLISGQTLTPDKTFVALSLFNLLRGPLDMLASAISTMAQATVSVKRLTKFMNCSDLDFSNVTRKQSSQSDTVVSITNGKFAWSFEDKPVLSDIKMSVPQGKLIAVVGPVGCGKSSLLSAILGDLEKVSGNVQVNGRTAFVSQQAWIQNATIKDNILFGEAHDSSRYNSVIEGCALTPDLQIFEAGDMTEIGEKGINLSGGQKQRVSLARAVYANRDIYLLDDPLSAVDAHVGKHIFDNVIGPNGLLRRKTRILVTHGLHWLSKCDEVIVMANGRITNTGMFKDLLVNDKMFAALIREHLTEFAEDEDTLAEVEADLDPQVKAIIRQISHESALERSLRKSQSLVASGSIRSRKSSRGKPDKPVVKRNKLVQEERQETGGVKWSLYWSFFKALDLKLFATWLGLFIGAQGIATFGNIWLTNWTSDPLLSNATLANTTQYQETLSMYIGVYGAAAAGQAIGILVHSIFFAMSSVRASRFMHEKMLQGVMRCPMSFFDTTPSGRVLNRFGKDVDVVDNVLPQTIRSWMTVLTQIVTAVFVIMFGFPIFIVFAVVIAVFYYFIQRFYIPTTRQLKRIESVTRSPIYNYLSETITGAPTIRAFSAQGRFLDELTKRIDTNSMSYLSSNSCNRWLAIRLQLLGNLTVFAVSVFAIIFRETTNSSIVGLVLSSSLQITNSLTMFVRQSSDLESNVVSVERLDEYSTLTSEADWERKEDAASKSWPESGQIVFYNFQTRYRPELPLVLNGISCEIKAGEKVGIVGRTGAGKSSLTLALFRLIESAGGHIEIDKVDISRLGLHQLRPRLTILPQDPVVFSESIRRNLDPFSRHTDDNLWEALDQAGLRDFVTKSEKGLLHECGENGESLSVGQRQLLCLARALLNKTKVLVLDEATAAVDVETDGQIMQTIRREFADCTVLIIAHRLHTVMDSDRVLVLSNGQIAEFDTPLNLLANPDSIFADMARKAGTSGQDDDELDDE